MTFDSVGRVWLDMVTKHHRAARANNNEEQEWLFDLIDRLEKLYPEECRKESEKWAPKE